MNDEELVARAIAQWNNRLAVLSREEQQQPDGKEQDESDDDEVEEDDNDDDGDRKHKADESNPRGGSDATGTTAVEGGKPRKKYRPRVKDPIHNYPVPPRLINAVHKPKSYVNHSYRDFSNVPPENGYTSPRTINEMTFAEKIHHMLSQPQFEAMIAWMPHGRAFRVLLPNDYEQQIMPIYFGHTRYSNFLSMIRQYGLKYFTQGPDKGCLYHEYMLRGLPHLAKYMPLARTPRRLIEDPANEPDLYAISKLYPVPLTAAVPVVVQPEAPRPVAAAAAFIPPQRPTPNMALLKAAFANPSSLSSTLALLRNSQYRPVASASIPNVSAAVAAAAAALSSYPTAQQQQQRAAALAAAARMDLSSSSSMAAQYLSNYPLAASVMLATYPGASSTTNNNMFLSNAIEDNTSMTQAVNRFASARQGLWLASQAANASSGAAAASHAFPSAGASSSLFSSLARQHQLNMDANTASNNNIRQQMQQQHQFYHPHRFDLESSIMNNAELFAAAAAAAAANADESKLNSNDSSPQGNKNSSRDYR